MSRMISIIFPRYSNAYFIIVLYVMMMGNSIINDEKFAIELFYFHSGNLLKLKCLIGEEKKSRILFFFI